MRTARRGRPNLKKILICTLAIICSPIAVSACIRVMPALSAAAERTALLSAGIAMPEGGRAAMESGLPAASKSGDASLLLPVEQPFISLEHESADTPIEEEFTQTATPENANEEGAYDNIIDGAQDGNILYYTYPPSDNLTLYLNLEKAGQVKNVTSVPNETLISEAKKLPEFTIETGGTQPQVLIMHTHTTESFEPYAREYYDNSYPSRTTDNGRNIVEVGEAIATELEAAGIAVLHDSTLHDYPSYSGSYERSAETVKKLLAQYPSIKVVLDIHRDAIIYENGDRVAPYTDINGRKAAQVMIISGCDDGTMNMPNYLQNFRLAALLEQQIEGDYPTLTRAVLFDYRKYNQDLTTGSLLIEVGGHANSLDQAVYSGHLIGQSIAKALLSIRAT